MAEYEKLRPKTAEFEADIKALETAADYHTVENRNKRKELQERRNAIAKAIGAIGQNMQQGQRAYRGSIRAWRLICNWRSMRRGGSGRKVEEAFVKVKPFPANS